MREVRCRAGETQETFLVFFLSYSHRRRLKQSQHLGPVMLWKDYPLPQHEGLFVTWFCLPFIAFSLSQGFLPLKWCCCFLEARCTGQRDPGLLLSKGRMETILSPLTLTYFVGSLPDHSLSLPDPYHSLSLPLLLLWSAHSNVPLAIPFPPCHVKPQHPGNECHLTSFILLIFLQGEWTHWQWKEEIRIPHGNTTHN